MWQIEDMGLRLAVLDFDRGGNLGVVYPNGRSSADADVEVSGGWIGFSVG